MLKSSFKARYSGFCLPVIKHNVIKTFLLTHCPNFTSAVPTFLGGKPDIPPLPLYMPVLTLPLARELGDLG